MWGANTNERNHHRRRLNLPNTRKLLRQPLFNQFFNIFFLKIKYLTYTGWVVGIVVIQQLQKYWRNRLFYIIFFFPFRNQTFLIPSEIIFDIDLKKNFKKMFMLVAVILVQQHFMRTTYFRQSLNLHEEEINKLCNCAI